jgi:hypothetical protein
MSDEYPECPWCLKRHADNHQCVTAEEASSLAAPACSAATCEWYLGPMAKRCQRTATAEVMAKHWKNPVAVCEYHAELANDFGFQVRQNSDSTTASRILT